MAGGLARDPRLSAWRAFVEAHTAVMDALERELTEQRGISLPWYDALLQLSEAPGCRLRMSELADSIVISRSGFSRAARRMEEAGLIARQPSPEDGRGAYVVLTDHGRRTFRRAAAVHLRGVASHFLRHLSEQEAAVMEAVLRRVRPACR
ncbi:MAG TPA: MarR family transcriptional regulator [Candidatus Eisenbacteria bacterium]|nr:MarR family transcriptional regulator [Candidatus Eisenbacteria bacterium]